ncbi:MAG: hypothetical protein BWK80_01595 [Desulfobacteraceae bacterium IS3]|nr:MAG: hypothetical protein BWK80_01595 [Desulfobacteraceae bacterium IS3]
MKKINRLLRCNIFLFLIIFGAFSISDAETYSNVPPQIQAALFLKLFAFNNDINKAEHVSVHVIDAPDFAEEMKKAVGRAIGASKLTEVNESPDLPSSKPSVIYIGNPEKFDKVKTYSSENKVLTITGIPELVEKGVTLGIASFDGKPKILLNISASESEGVNWNPAIMKISTVFK